MLFQKPLSSLTSDDIRVFCRTFSEGIRVEYKEALSDGVRRKIAAVVSSFANSYGGVLIIGVRTERGLPVEPIQGFDAPAEETRLTIENLCLSGITPVLVPRVQEVRSDVEGRIFVVVEVDQSAEAPHAIENSRRVYIRTGDSNTPYDLSDVPTLERLLERRKLAENRWTSFEAESLTLLKTLAKLPIQPMLHVLVGPRFPSVSLADREAVLRFGRSLRYNGAIVNLDCHRDPAGVSGFRGTDIRFQRFMRINSFGQLMTVHRLQPFTEQVAVDGQSRDVERFTFSHVAADLHVALSSVALLYELIQFRGDVIIRARLTGVRAAQWRISREHDYEVKSLADVIPSETFATAEALRENITDILTHLMVELVWPFVPAQDSLQNETVAEWIGRWFRERPRVVASIE